MDAEYNGKYKRMIEKIETLLSEKELGPELEEFFSYCFEVLQSSREDKKRDVYLTAKELIDMVKDFPSKNKVRR